MIKQIRFVDRNEWALMGVLECRRRGSSKWSLLFVSCLAQFPYSLCKDVRDKRTSSGIPGHFNERRRNKEKWQVDQRKYDWDRHEEAENVKIAHSQKDGRLLQDDADIYDSGTTDFPSTQFGNFQFDAYDDDFGFPNDIMPPPPMDMFTFSPLYEVKIPMVPFVLKFKPTTALQFTQSKVNMTDDSNLSGSEASAKFIATYMIKNTAVDVDELLGRKFVVEWVDVGVEAVSFVPDSDAEPESQADASTSHFGGTRGRRLQSQTTRGNTYIQFNGTLFATSPEVSNITQDEEDQVNDLISETFETIDFKTRLSEYLEVYVGNDLTVEYVQLSVFDMDHDSVDQEVQGAGLEQENFTDHSIQDGEDTEEISELTPNEEENGEALQKGMGDSLPSSAAGLRPSIIAVAAAASVASCFLLFAIA